MSGAWLALAAFFSLLALPGRAVARAEQLVTAGRLVPRPCGRRRRWRLPWWAAPGCLAAGAVGGVYLRAGPLPAAVTAVVAAVVGVLLGDARSRRAAGRVDAQALVSVRVLVGELTAGSSAPAALGAAAGAAPLLAEGYLAAARVARRGGAAGPVLASARHPGVRAVGHAWAVGETHGGALAGVLTRVAHDLEAAAAQQRLTAVALAGPRSSAGVLAGLPLLGLVLGTAMGARPLAFLLDVAAGRAVCCVGVLLDAAGVLWVRHILRRAERPP